MRLSVLSALARMNVDPWEEAVRLATLPTPDAQKTLVSTLNLFPGKRQRSEETELLAAQLIALLPKANEAKTAKTATVTGTREKRNSYWLVWLCFAIAMSLLLSHQHATTSAEDSRPTSNATPPAERNSGKPALSDVTSGSELAQVTLPTVPSAGMIPQ